MGRAGTTATATATMPYRVPTFTFPACTLRYQLYIPHLPALPATPHPTLDTQHEAAPRIVTASTDRRAAIYMCFLPGTALIGHAHGRHSAGAIGRARRDTAAAPRDPYRSILVHIAPHFAPSM